MAQGGTVRRFCDAGQPHDPGCQYFQDGGPVIDPSDVTLDQPAPAAGGQPEIDPNDVTLDSDRFSTPGQMALTGIEGAAQGFAGPVATLAEKGLSALGVPGLSDSDITARQLANPWVHGIAQGTGLITSFATGAGEAGLIVRGLSALGNLSKAGTAVKLAGQVISSGLASGLIQGGDEVSKWLLGQGDPTAPVGAAMAHMGAAGLFGLAGGAVGAVGKTALKAAAEFNAGGKIASFLHGFGSAAQDSTPAARALNAQLYDDALLVAPEAKGMSGSSFRAGQKAYDDFVKHGIKKGVSEATQAAGASVGGLPGLLVGKMVGKPVGAILQTLAPKVSQKVIAPLSLKVLASGRSSGLIDLLNHADSVAAGNAALDSAIGRLFQAAPRAVAGAATSAYASDSDNDALAEYIKGGGFNKNIQDQIYQDHATVPQETVAGMAEGGEVTPPALAPVDQGGTGGIPQTGLGAAYPGHDLLLNAAKGRISNYLQSLQPQAIQPKLAFDADPPRTEMDKKYARALSVANAPLSVLEDLRQGKMRGDQVQHLKAMYPELDTLIQQRLTKRIVEAQMAGEKPSYVIRQGLSQLMGTPMSSDFKPSTVLSTQAIFQAGAAQRSAEPATGQKAPKTSKSSLSKAGQNAMTGSQALAARQQRQS